MPASLKESQTPARTVGHRFARDRQPPAAGLFATFHSPPRPERRDVVLYGMLLAAGFAVALLRFPLPWRYILWSEDGAVFLEQALGSPLWPTLFTPYAGYLHFVPRTVAWLVSGLPLEVVPLATSLIMACLTSLLAVAIFFLAAAHLRTRIARLLLWALVVASPIAAMEIALSSANFQWYLLAGAMIAALCRRPGRAATIVAAGVLTAAFTSSILVLLLLPVLGLRALVFRRGGDLLLLAIGSLGSVAQLAGMLFGSRTPSGATATLWEFVSLYLGAVVEVGWVGPGVARALSESAPVAVIAIAGLLLAVTGWGAWICWRHCTLAATALVISWLYYVPVMILTGVATMGPLGLLSQEVSTRYLFFPVFAIGVAIVVFVDVLARRGRSRAVTMLALLLVVSQIVVMLVSYRAFDPRAHHLPLDDDWGARVDSARDACASGETDVYLRGSVESPFDWDTIVVTCEVLSQGSTR